MAIFPQHPKVPLAARVSNRAIVSVISEDPVTLSMLMRHRG